MSSLAMKNRLVWKVSKIHIKTQSASKAMITRLKKLNSKAQKKIFLIGAIIACLNFALSLFSVYTLLSFTFMILMAAGCLKISISQLKKKGLITYLSPGAQKILLQRSIFDILCDIWFFQRISIIIRALITPFIVKIDPKEAAEQFRDFSPTARKAILTKGLVHIMPGFVRSALLPDQEIILEEESDVSTVVDVREEDVISGSGLVVKTSEISGRTNNKVLFNRSLDKCEINNHNDTTHISTDEDVLINHNFSRNKQIELKKKSPSFGDVNTLSVHLDYQNKDKDKRSLRQQVQANKGLRHKEKSNTRRSLNNGETFNSNQPSRRRLMYKPQTSETWDQLELFIRGQREKLVEERLAYNKPLKIVELNGSLQKLQDIVAMLSKEELMKKLEDKKIMRIFLASSLALLIQLSISKRTRTWCYNTLSVILYISAFALSTGSIGILMLKMKMGISKWKKQRKLEVIKESIEDEESKDDEN